MKKFVWLMAVPVAVFVLACAAPSNSTNTGGGGTQIGGTTTTAVETPIAISSSAAAPIAVTSTAPVGPFTAFKAGTYEVGNAVGQVKPGKYKTTVPDGFIAHCYWERLSSLDGDFNSIIANDNLFEVGTPGILTVKATDKGVKVSGDCEWKLS